MCEDGDGNEPFVSSSDMSPTALTPKPLLSVLNYDSSPPVILSVFCMMVSSLFVCLSVSA